MPPLLALLTNSHEDLKGAAAATAAVANLVAGSPANQQVLII
jgi:hypothetical protein